MLPTRSCVQRCLPRLRRANNILPMRSRSLSSLILRPWRNLWSHKNISTTTGSRSAWDSGLTSWRWSTGFAISDSPSRTMSTSPGSLLCAEASSMSIPIPASCRSVSTSLATRSTPSGLSPLRTSSPRSGARKWRLCPNWQRKLPRRYLFFVSFPTTPSSSAVT